MQSLKDFISSDSSWFYIMTVLKFLQLKEKESLDNLLILCHLVSEIDGLLTVKGLKWRLREGPLSCPVFCGAEPLCLRPLQDMCSKD